VLLDCGAIEQVDERRENGARVRYYAATARAIFTEEDFLSLPPAVRGSLSAATFSALGERFQESLLSGTVDSLVERHLTWIPLQVDREAFLRIVKWQDAVFSRLKSTEAEAKERMEETGEEPMHMTVGMMGFESPSPIRDHVVDM
jgi:hypothetical protein